MSLLLVSISSNSWSWSIMDCIGFIPEIYKIIKSVLGTNDENNFNHIKNIVDEEAYSNIPKYKEIITYLNESYKTYNQFPTEEVFVNDNRFKEFKAVLASIQALDKESLAYIVKVYIEKSKRKVLAEKLTKLAQTVSANGVSAEVAEEIRQATKVSNDTLPDPLEKHNILAMYEEDKHREAGIKTYIKALDRLIGGIQRGTISVVAGASGHGKTTWAVNMAYKAVRDGKRIVYISLEVPLRDLLYDLVSLHSNDPKFNGHRLQHNKIRTNSLSQEEYEQFKIVKDDLEENILPNFIILTERNFNQFSYSEVTDTLYKIDDAKPIFGIFVDHANLLKFQSKGKHNTVGDAINEYISFFRQMAICFRKDQVGKDRQISVILLCQINRTGLSKASDTGKNDERKAGKYDINALAEANELERASSYVFTCYVNEAMKSTKEARVQLLKNRFGRSQEEPEKVCVDLAYYSYGAFSDDDESGIDFSEVSNDFSTYMNVDLNSELDDLNIDLDI